MADACGGSRVNDISAWRTTGTPRPWTNNVVGAGLLAHGSLLLSGLPEAAWLQ